MEEIIIVAIVFGSILAMVKIILDHVGSRKDPSDRSMTTTELSETIDDAVNQATRDLRKRIENLEAIAVDQPISNEPRLLDEFDDGEEIQPEDVRQGRRVRS